MKRKITPGANVIRANERRKQAVDLFLKRNGDISMEELGWELSITADQCGKYISEYFRNKKCYKR